MLGNNDVVATLAAKDLTAARRFYEDTLEAIVGGLKHKGVAFEHYDIPGAIRSGDVHAFGEMKSAWFKDPDGNIIALVNR